MNHRDGRDRRGDDEPGGPRPRAVAVLGCAALLGVGGYALGPHRALLLLAAPTTFAMPVVAALAEWRSGAAGHRISAVAVNLLALIVLAVALTLAGQAVAGHADPSRLFSVRTGTSIPSYPFLVPLGALTYVTFLQLSVVSEGRRLLPAHLGRIAGPLAILACLAVAVIAYLLLTNLDDVSAAQRHAIGLRPTTGALPALDLVTWLIAITGWQAVFNLLDGWPLSGVNSTAVRIAASNVVVVALGTATYVLARGPLEVSPGELSAAAAMVAAGTSVMKGLLGGWPLGSARGAVRRAWLLAGTLVLAAAGDLGLRALALAVDDGFTTAAPVQLWLVVCGLNLVGGGVLIAGPICGWEPVARER